MDLLIIYSKISRCPLKFGRDCIIVSQTSKNKTLISNGAMRYTMAKVNGAC